MIKEKCHLLHFCTDLFNPHDAETPAKQVLENKKHSRGFTELFSVAGPVLVPSVSEPRLDPPLGEATMLCQAHDLHLNTHKYTFIQGSA